MKRFGRERILKQVGTLVAPTGYNVEDFFQLMSCVQMEAEYTLIGGILRFGTMARVCARS